MTDGAHQLEIDWTREAERRSPAGLALSDDERRVLAVLERHRGRDDAVVSRDLARASGVSARRLRTVLRHLRIHHLVPIGSRTSGTPGYYLITSADELREVRDSMVRRGVQCFLIARACDSTRMTETFLGQLRLAGVDVDAAAEDEA